MKEYAILKNAAEKPNKYNVYWFHHSDGWHGLGCIANLKDRDNMFYQQFSPDAKDWDFIDPDSDFQFFNEFDKYSYMKGFDTVEEVKEYFKKVDKFLFETYDLKLWEDSPPSYVLIRKIRQANI